jgi:hypothetical protein
MRARRIRVEKDAGSVSDRELAAAGVELTPDQKREVRKWNRMHGRPVPDHAK